jgi:uncharacterized alkaline shock family protein YloU
MKDLLKKIDSKEFVFPETTFIRDIETKIFQSIIAQCLLKIDGIGLIEGTLIDSLFGREASERNSGISVEQDPKNHSLCVKIEINIAYGVVIPEKSEEIQTKITKELSHLTGLHVSAVHIIFKNIIPKPSTSEEAVCHSKIIETKG